MKYTALPLVVIDAKQLLYTRYYGLGQKRVFKAEETLTRQEVELLRAKPTVLGMPNDVA